MGTPSFADSPTTEIGAYPYSYSYSKRVVMAEPSFDHGVSENRIEYEYRDAEYEYEPTAGGGKWGKVTGTKFALAAEQQCSPGSPQISLSIPIGTESIWGVATD